MSDDWRPIISEQISAKNIVFTLDDKYITFDICGDNRLVVLNWDDIPNLVEKKEMIVRFNRFKQKNMKVIDYLRQNMYKDRSFDCYKYLFK